MTMFTGKRAAAVLAAAAALSMGLAGCSNPTAQMDDTDTSAADYWPEATANLDGVELTMWVAQNSNKIPVKVVEDFEKATGATVELETIPDPYEQNVQTKITTGDSPDLAFWQPTQSMLAGFIAQDKLQKLDDAPWVADYTDGIADAGGVVERTRAELAAADAARKIKDANVEGVESPLFEMGGSQWGTQYSVQIQLAEAAQDGLWDRVNSGEETFSDETIQTAVDNYKALFDEGLYNKDAGSAKDTDEAAALWEGKTAMVICVNSLFNQVAALASNDKAALDETIGFLPLSSEGNIGTVIPEQNNSVVAFKTGDAKKEAASRQFINFWLTEDYENFVKDQGVVSVIKDVETPDNVPQALLDSAAAVSNSVGSMQSLAIANPDLYINLADMINGTKTPQDVTKATQDQFAQLAKAQGAEGF